MKTKDKLILGAFLLLVAGAWVSGYSVGRREQTKEESPPAETHQVDAENVALSQNMAQGPITVRPGQERALIGAFLMTWNPRRDSQAAINKIAIQLGGDSGLELLNPRLEVNEQDYLARQSPLEKTCWDFWRPVHVPLEKGRLVRVNLYADIGKASKGGVYSAPTKLVGWSLQINGDHIPLPMTVDGQPIVVL